MFVYGVCIGPSDRFDRVLKPTLPQGVVLLTRTHQRSIFDAYNSILDEACARWPDLEGVVLLHEDVAIRDSSALQRTLREVFAEPSVGAAGAVGGVGHWEMSCWKTNQMYGHVEHATHKDDFSRGEHDVDTVDGLFIALSPRAARMCRLDGKGYPGFHGYDSELCFVVRNAGLRVIVSDFDLFHDCKPGPWTQPEYGWAMFEWLLRRHATNRRTRLTWRVKRFVLASMTRLGFRTVPFLSE